MDVWKEKVQQDINSLKIKQEQDRKAIDLNIKDIQELKMNDKLQDREISSLKEVLTEIKSDTRYIRDKMDSDRDDALKQHRSLWWKVLAAIIIAALAMYFGRTI